MKNKLLIIVGMVFLLGSIGMVSAASSITGSIDLFGLFAEDVFGNILASGFGIAIFILIIAAIAGLSMPTTIFILFSYTVAFGAGYVGPVIGIPMFFGAYVYFVMALWSFFNRGR